MVKLIGYNLMLSRMNNLCTTKPGFKVSVNGIHILMSQLHFFAANTLQELMSTS